MSFQTSSASSLTLFLEVHVSAQRRQFVVRVRGTGTRVPCSQHVATASQVLFTHTGHSQCPSPPSTQLALRPWATTITVGLLFVSTTVCDD